jgi:DNA-binding beta-propeller fold protein YncE
MFVGQGWGGVTAGGRGGPSTRSAPSTSRGLLPCRCELWSLGARGAVYSIDIATGEVAKVAGGFLGATNLAVAPDGTIYVAEMFNGRISTVSGSGAQPFADLPFPAAVEWANGKLYATVDVFGNGSVVTITP